MQPRPIRHLSGEDAKEDEDEHPLEGVGDGEQIGREGGLVEDVQHSEGPGGSQHEQQGHGAAGTGPGATTLTLTKSWSQQQRKGPCRNFRARARCMTPEK